MKKLITTSIFVLFLVLGLKAQQALKVPTFTQPSVLVFIHSAGSNFEYTFYDGGVASPMQMVPITKGVLYAIQIIPHVAYFTNEITKQGYKISVTNEGQELVHNTYYFIKD